MINVKKGSAHSLAQSDFIGALTTPTVAGAIVYKDTDGGIKLATATTSATNARVGFAINDSTQGDVISSNKIGVYGLDGNSVIETSEFTGAITDYVIGAKVGVSATAGKVCPFASGLTVGTVVESRTLHNTVLLGIKLAA
jgi:hypothetical protein